MVSTKDIMTKFLIDSGLFVDDYKVVFFVIPAGSRWDEEKRKMVIHEDKIEEDRERRGDVRTMEDMTKMANSIISIIKWTNDCPGSNQDGKMPILNLKVWMREKVGKQQICFESHRKRMASPYRTLQKEHHRVGSGSLGQESPGR